MTGTISARQPIVLVFAVVLLAAGCADAGPDWRRELIELSQSEYAQALYYTDQLDDTNVDATMQAQCVNFRSALDAQGSTSTSIVYQIVASVSSQIEGGVPLAVIDRDLLALELGMAEKCPDVHELAVRYFGFEDFTRLSTCTTALDASPGNFCQVGN